MIKVDSSVIKLPKQALKDGVVILGMGEYIKLRANSVPTYYLTGKKAKELDKLVEQGLKEHREGKTKRLNSLVDLR